MKSKRPFKAGLWWATVRPCDPQPMPCLWGKDRREAEEHCDPDEIAIRIYVCEAKDR